MLGRCWLNRGQDWIERGSVRHRINSYRSQNQTQKTDDDSGGPKALHLRLDLLKCQRVFLLRRQSTCIDIEEF